MNNFSMLPVVSPGVFYPDLPSFNQENQTLQDKIRLLDQVATAAANPPVELLEILIPGGKTTQNIFSNGHINFVLKDYWQWQEEPIVFAADQSCAGNQQRQVLHNSGTWVNLNTSETGQGVLSLAQSVHRVDPYTAFEWVAMKLGIYLSDYSVPQLEVDTADIYYEQAESSGWMHMPPHPWLIWPTQSYHFATEFGQLSFLLEEWKTPEGQVRLFRSLTLNTASGVLEWKFVRPPVEEILFNKHRLFRERNLPVRIYDDIALAAQNAFHPDFVATWAGEADYTVNIDWSLLAGREVTYASSLVTQDSFIIGETLHNILRGIQTDLTFEKNR